MKIVCAGGLRPAGNVTRDGRPGSKSAIYRVDDRALSGCEAGVSVGSALWRFAARVSGLASVTIPCTMALVIALKRARRAGIAIVGVRRLPHGRSAVPGDHRRRPGPGRAGPHRGRAAAAAHRGSRRARPPPDRPAGPADPARIGGTAAVREMSEPCTALPWIPEWRHRQPGSADKALTVGDVRDSWMVAHAACVRGRALRQNRPELPNRPCRGQNINAVASAYWAKPQEPGSHCGHLC